jgi:hypothetical protein
VNRRASIFEGELNLYTPRSYSWVSGIFVNPVPGLDGYQAAGTRYCVPGGLIWLVGSESTIGSGAQGLPMPSDPIVVLQLVQHSGQVQHGKAQLWPRAVVRFRDQLRGDPAHHNATADRRFQVAEGLTAERCGSSSVIGQASAAR